MKKKLVLIPVIMLVLFVIWRIILLIFSGSSTDQNQRTRPPVAVEAAPVHYGPLSEIRELTGTVFPIYRYVIAPKVSGRLLVVKKRIGDWVKAGEIVAVIDNAEYEQGVFEAEANLKIAEASLAESRSQLELAGQDKERIESLQAKGIASPAELDAAVSNYRARESRYHLAQAQVQQRQASLKLSRIRLSYTQLTASKPGYVGERYVDEGTLLSSNSAVVSIIGIDSVFIRTTIIERDYGRIHQGQPARVSVDAFPEITFTGFVSRIAPMLQETSRVAEMEVEVDNNLGYLKPGMFARVEVITATEDSTQMVPSIALVNRNGAPGVFLIQMDKTQVSYISVKTGIITPEYTEIRFPPLEGKVITLGQHLLEDSSPVLLPKAIPEKQRSDSESSDEKERQE